MGNMQGNSPTGATGIGTISDVRILDNTVFLRIDFAAAKDLSPILKVERADGGVQKVDLRKTPDGEFTATVDPLPAIRRMSIEAGGMTIEDTTSPLVRLASTTAAEINANLRWSNRIQDLETRFFAARNSFLLNKRDFGLSVRCVASVSYTAIENDNQRIVEWCGEICRDLSKQVLACKDAELRASFLSVWLNVAVARCDAESFLRAYDMFLPAAKGMAAFPLAGYNLLYCALLLGGADIGAGRRENAAEIFGGFDHWFRVCVKDYPRALVNWGEMVTITRKAHFCAIGMEITRGRKLRPGIPYLTLALAWTEGSRLRNREAVTRLIENYRTIALSLEDLRAARRRNELKEEPSPMASYDDLPLSEAGKLTTGKIAANEAVLECRLTRPADLALEIFRVDGTAQRISLGPQPVGDGAHKVPFTPLPAISAMAVVAITPEGTARLPHDPATCFYDRLLSRTLDEVNRNLRWGARIGDINTRMFASMNSLEVIEDIEAAQKAIVSFAYTAVETNRPELIAKTREICDRYFDRIIASGNPDLCASLLCFMVHLAIAQKDRALMERLVEPVVATAAKASELPLSAYNSIHAASLLGAYFLFGGDKAKAKRIFDHGDALMVLTAANHPRGNYGEIIKVTRIAFLCYAGTFMAQGKPLPVSLPKDMQTPPELSQFWASTTRIYGEGPRKRLLEHLTAMTKIH